VDAAEYARPNTGARIYTRKQREWLGAHYWQAYTRGNNANSALPVDSPEGSENKK